MGWTLSAEVGDDHRDEQDRRDLPGPAVLRRWMTIIAHAGGPGTSPVHEPGDDGGTGDEAEEVAGDAEEDALGGLISRGASAGPMLRDPARREGRRGGRLCTLPVYGAVRRASSAGTYGCSGCRTEPLHLAS